MSAPGGTVLQRLMPPGRLWNYDSGSTLQRTLLALGDEIDRVVSRGVDLINESDPRTATETISDWETALGLPDDRVPVLPVAIGARRAAVVQKLLARGGQDLPFFVALAAACGWTLTVSLWESLRVGFHVGDRCYGEEFAYSVSFALSSPIADALPIADVQRILRAVVHAHIVVVFP